MFHRPKPNKCLSSLKYEAMLVPVRNGYSSSKYETMLVRFSGAWNQCTREWCVTALRSHLTSGSIMRPVHGKADAPHFYTEMLNML